MVQSGDTFALMVLGAYVVACGLMVVMLGRVDRGDW